MRLEKFALSAIHHRMFLRLNVAHELLSFVTAVDATLRDLIERDCFAAQTSKTHKKSEDESKKSRNSSVIAQQEPVRMIKNS